MDVLNTLKFSFFADDEVYVESEKPVSLEMLLKALGVILYLIPKDIRKEAISQILSTLETGDSISIIKKNANN